MRCLPEATEQGRSNASGGRPALWLESCDLCSFTAFPFTGLKKNKAIFKEEAGIHILLAVS